MNAMLNLSRCRKRISSSHTGCIVRLLKTLGVPGPMIYVRRLSENGSFWLRRINHLQVLEQARQLYRRQIIELHPDKPGGCLERTIQLNWTWREVERRFKQHGHELF